MLEVQSALLSNYVTEKQFVCHLERCKGACCVEGDEGAPLTEEEATILEKILPEILPFITKAGQKVIEKEGTSVENEEGIPSTPTIGGKECVYSFYNEQKQLKCGIEQAYREKKIDFQKPISCHLYPIRIKKSKTYQLVNFDQWDVCQPACELGEQLQVPLYKFLKEALIRYYGPTWYEELVSQIETK